MEELSVHQQRLESTPRARRVSFEDGLAVLPKHFAGDEDLIMSHFWACLSAVFPDGEDYFVRSVRHYRDQVVDPVLKRQVAGFIGQEATHGREHRALNERLDALGYRSAFVERVNRRAIALEERVLSPSANLALTVALEHLTAVLAELVLTDERVRETFGRGVLRDIYLWHALEESEHKAVAFDVYLAVGASERTRVWSMRMLRYSLAVSLGFGVAASVLLDADTYRPGRLRWSVRRLHASPLLNRELWEALKDFERPGFHPNARETKELVHEWRVRLFGNDGQLRGRLDVNSV